MRAACALVFCLPLVLTGCSFGPTAELAPDTGLAIQGAVHGGQQPISGAHVYMFAANTTGNAGPGIAASSSNASLSLLSSTGNSDSLGSYVLTDANGNFSITGDYSCTPNTQVYLYSLGGNPGLGTGVNPAAGLIAALGNCPSAGNFLTATPYIVISEVSTIGAAYAFSGYATDATHVSSSGSSLAKTGIKNAFANAANLTNLSNGAALATTPAGNGTVPQTTIYTLANVLASCVNSNGAVTGPTNPTACYTLFNNATSNGTSAGTIPSDTATAAINIAHNPGANVATLFSLPTATAPFPQLGSLPTDFTLGIQFISSDLSAPYSVAIDGSGNAWVANSTGASITEFSSSGSVLSGTNGFTGGGVGFSEGIAVDLSGNVWVTNLSGNSVSEFSNLGVPNSNSPFTAGSTMKAPYGVAIDGSNHVWITNSTNSSSGNSIIELSNSGASMALYNGTSSGLVLNSPRGIAIDGQGNVWVASTNNSAVAELTNAGGVLSTGYTGGSLNHPYGIAIDGSGNAWIPNYTPTTTTSNVTELSPSVTPVGGSPFNEGGSYGPQSIAIDGSGNVWVADKDNSSFTEFNSSGVSISPSTGYTGANLSKPVAIALDGSGNVWVANAANSTMTELIGASTPVLTPLALGVKNNTLATRP